MTYEQVKAQLSKLQDTMSMYDNLIYCGIPQKDVHYFEKPDVSSGYNMGEEISCRCGCVIIKTFDNREYYYKSCKWRENHGYIIIRFTRKGLKEYVNVCKRIQCTKDIEERVELYKRQSEIIKKFYDSEHSTINQKKGIRI